jgi:large subunit ribosomal protein L17
MRHKAQVAHFGRDTDHRRAMIRNLVNSLVEHGRIQTTVAKAKELRRHAERAVTLAKKGDLNTRRLLLSRFPHEPTVQALMADLAVRFKTRPGGYTRILKVGSRAGDNAQMALIEWVDYALPAKAEEGADKSAAKKASPKKAGAKATGTKKKAAKKTQE